MQTELADFIRDTEQGQAANAILRKCVHCGFCAATCPTYQLLGDELDSPRGRIYLIKQVLEGNEPTKRTQLHLDRCLTCRSCETTCPSGVEYGKLLDIGREVVESKVDRNFLEKMIRRALVFLLPKTLLTSLMITASRSFKLMLPASLKKKIPVADRAKPWVQAEHDRKMIIHQGCVQRVSNPSINSAASRFLDKLQISSIRTKDSCCGALGHHLGDHQFFTKHAKRNIDAWWPHIEAGAQAVVSTASGCGVMIKDYGNLLKNDPEYAEKAEKVSAMTIDLSEVPINGTRFVQETDYQTVAFHSPCTLQHGQKIRNTVENILSDSGINLVQVQDSHLCCGSAGTYSILQSKLSQQLLERKISSLEAQGPDCIVTANIGCLMHLCTASSVPVKHWVEIVAPP